MNSSRKLAANQFLVYDLNQKLHKTSNPILAVEGSGQLTVGNTQNIIEINGKKYDAVTGALISTAAPVHPAPTHTAEHSTTAEHSAKESSAPKAATQSPTPKAINLEGVVRRPKNGLRSSYTSSVKSPDIKPQKSKTLMRAAVKKPTQPLSVSKQHASASGNNPALVKPVITPRTIAAPLQRAQHADTIAKSSFIQKFAPGHAASTGNKATPEQKTAHIQHAPVAVQPAPSTSSTIKHNRNTNKTTDLLEKALQAAKGHNEPFFQHKQSFATRLTNRLGVSKRTAAISTAVMAGVLLGGFYAYQNVPNLAMRVAATKAGFHAGMPGYAPAGFSFKGPVQYSSGQVIISFHSNTDERTYQVTQQASNWSSDTLLNNYVIASGKQYQTFQDRGRTIYIYDNSSATWVNGGVWYQIDGKSDLTSDQLVRIAASM